MKRRVHSYGFACYPELLIVVAVLSMILAFLTPLCSRLFGLTGLYALIPPVSILGAIVAAAWIRSAVETRRMRNTQHRKEVPYDGK